MQVAIKTKDEAQGSQRLVNELAYSLQQTQKLRGEPLVVENRIAQTKSIHVIVIWDNWIDLSPSERSAVIRESFLKAKRARGETMTVAMGLTTEEALRLRFLPFSIITTRRHGDTVSPNELAKAMDGAGGVTVKVGSSTQIRFSTLEQAEDAYRYLSQAVPGPYWAIVQEQATAE